MTNMDFSDPRFWFDVVQTVVIAALWLRKPGEDAGMQLVQLNSRMDVMDERMKHVPSAQELTALEGRLETAIQRIEHAAAEVRNTADAVDRIEEFLRNTR